MNSPEYTTNYYSLKKEYPQVENLFLTLNISEVDKKQILDEFSRVANLIYERLSKISYDTISKIKLGETNRNSFSIINPIEETLIDEYFNFIHSYSQGEKMWRVLLAYYKPSQKIIDYLNF